MEHTLPREGRATIDASPLVLRAQDGDLRAFESLLEARLAALFRLALAIVGDEAEARDAVQQACVLAWRELPRLRERDRFDAWLHRIVANECRMSLRGRRRRRVREIAISHLDPERSLDLEAAAIPGPAEQSEATEILERAFDRLDGDARTLLVLHHLEGRSVTEIAAELGLPVSTIKWRLHRARTSLEQALEQERR